MDLPIIQLIVSTAVTIIVPWMAFYVNARINAALLGFKLELALQLGKYQSDAAVRETKSDARYVDIERRLAITENGHSSISNRLDLLVTALRAEGAQRENNHQRAGH
jgi:hypothetical protein